MASTFERVRELVHLLAQKRSWISREALQSELDWSRGTFFRVLRAARDAGHNIKEDRKYGGYHLEGQEPAEGRWHFGTLDLLALADRVDGGQLGHPGVSGDRESLQAWVQEQMREHGLDFGRLEGRVRFAPVHWRPDSEKHLRSVAEALLHRRVLRFQFTDSVGKKSARIVSPQRLVLYRSGWTLDAWDHDVGGLRQFALDQMGSPRVKNQLWKEILCTELDRHFAQSYGLWAGEIRGEAVLRFRGVAAHYARREVWFVGQKMDEEPDGSVVLRFPYSGLPELVGDILRWGEDVEVLGSEELQRAVWDKVLRMAALVRKKRN